MCIYYVRLIVSGHSVVLFAHMILLCKFLLALCLPYGAVYHLGEKGQGYYFAGLCNIDLLYDNITGHKVKLVFLCVFAVMLVPLVLSLGVYE